MKGIGCALVGPSEARLIVISACGLQDFFYLGKLRVDPVIEFLAAFLYRKLAIEGVLEGRLVEKVEEIPVV